MKRPTKWLLRIVAVLLVLAASCAAVVYALTESRLTQTYEVVAETVMIPTDDASLARGRHVAIISGCVDCHGDNLAGRVFFENAMIGRFVASNLTAGKGGVGARFSDQDWIRAIRHGVRPDGKPLLVMPSKGTTPSATLTSVLRVSREHTGGRPRTPPVRFPRWDAS